MMADLGQMCLDARKALGWPYQSPGTNDQRGIDCSGLMVYLMRRQGLKIAHGSNTIWRKHLGDKGSIGKGTVLSAGMMVFRHRSGTPKKFCDNAGDYYHMGLVVSEAPLRIIHASSVKGKVVEETSARGWDAWGILKGAERKTLILGMRGEDVRQLQRLLNRRGFRLAEDGVFGKNTQSAVQAFRCRMGLGDGIAADLRTRKALEKEA